MVYQNTEDEKIRKLAHCVREIFMNLNNIKPDIRYLRDMENVVYDKEWTKTSPGDLEMYYVYRGIERKNGLSYDITIIPPKMLGQEFVKTKGHQHLCKETYKVLEGEGIFLIQKTKEKEIEDVYLIKAKKDDKITIPPNYDHTVINSTNQELKLGNWISEDCQNNYSLLEKMEGACYFYTKGPAKGKVNWVKNKNYKKVPELRFEK